MADPVIPLAALVAVARGAYLDYLEAVGREPPKDLPDDQWMLLRVVAEAELSWRVQAQGLRDVASRPCPPSA